jgi:transposase
MTIKDVSNHVNLNWHTVKEIDKDYLKKHYSKPSLKNVQYIAIDEFAYHKGHKYKTVVYDLENGRALYVGEGRDAKALEPFWKRLKCAGAKVKAVATDMWPAYWSTAMEALPNASIVFDLFHIVKKYNECLDRVRIAIYRDEKDLNKRNVIKGTKWILLKNEENLNQERDEKERLKEVLKVNEPLSIAYYLKDELRLIWQQSGIRQADKALEQWFNKAQASGLTELKSFAKMLNSHRTGILNWYKHPISTGPLEGFNNKIKVLKRKAYGYRDSEYFDLKIKSLHITRYELLR